MKVFISWSQEPAKEAALALKELIRDVIQAADPWVSDVDIEPGSRSLNEIMEALQGTGFGIVVVTAQNLDRPWLNFEAGAMAAKFDKINVVPYLVGVDDRTIVQRSPLGQLGYQAVTASKADTLRLLQNINEKLALERRVEPDRLERLYELVWTRFSERLDAAIAQVRVEQAVEGGEGGLDVGAALAEILRRVRRIDERQPEIDTEWARGLLAKHRLLSGLGGAAATEAPESFFRSLDRISRAAAADAIRHHGESEPREGVDHGSRPPAVVLRELLVGLPVDPPGKTMAEIIAATAGDDALIRKSVRFLVESGAVVADGRGEGDERFLKKR